MDRNKIMIVDDDISHLEYTSRVIERNFQYNTLELQDSREVSMNLEKGGFCAVLLDINMPHLNGLELLTDINYRFPEIPVVVVTAAEDSETVVSAMRQGAFDYVTKSSGKNRLIAAVTKAVKHFFTMKELSNLKQEVLEPTEYESGNNKFITRSPRMTRIFGYIKNIAPTPNPVLITGETGTGKELIAELIYDMSGFEGELVKVNVAGLDDNIFSDTLFGHVKGAFTGADGRREGLVKAAENGILFLDEIGDLEHSSQVKLLRLLQDSSYYALGHDKVQHVNLKIIAATNRDLKAMSDKGLFRKDLYYRLMFQTVEIPPLRERKEDIFSLVNHILENVAEEYNMNKPSITASALTYLRGYDFPGNVRELEGIFYDLVAESRPEIIDDKLVAEYFNRKGLVISGSYEAPDDTDKLEINYRGTFPTMKEVNDHMIKLALEETEGNISRAAAILGINRQTIYRRFAE
jgi:two-component system nitrogen regulation response regulator GlnG